MTGVLDLNQYMIREKFWKIFGNKFWFEDVNEKRYGFCEQKRFKLKEDIRIYVDESKSQEWLKIKQKQMVDAWGGYDIMDSESGEHIGTVRRKFWASVLRTRWHLLDAAGNEIGMLIEDSMGYALARRILLGILLPKKFHIEIGGGGEFVTMRQMFNPFIKKLVVNIPPSHPLDRRFIAGLAIVIAAIDGRGK
ncbi:MAG: hypothetical protein QGH48_01705 [Candidatus Poseidoniia archaeon]|jgi:uncharacterized protein YxjI|nr:hypothetical protein [Candidatus Poseidoniia archaeon]MDP6591815.1 hypothetical protein [Candidatus Poseidoniia archaeon]|tara:strand:+ start:10160 stop:10738 length:579 start_codon:yes stop_codon:yes gene_type:complete